MSRLGGALRRLAAWERAEALSERMDAPDVNGRRLERTYRQFVVVNQLLSGWSEVYRRHLLPVARKAARERGIATLLDVGCGGGDIAKRLAAWASRDGLALEITGIDPDPRALHFARSRATPPNVRFLLGRAERLVEEGRVYDLVVSNHVLHHLPSGQVASFLDVSARLSRCLTLHNDLRRSPLALPAFAAFSLPFGGSFIAGDGLRSIRRSFTPSELTALAPPRWRVRPMPPFRLLLILERDDG